MSIAGLVADGYITSGATAIYLTIPCGKRLDHINSVNMSGEGVWIRQNNNYLIGSSNTPGNFNAGELYLGLLKDIGCIQLTYVASSAIANAVNNETLAAHFLYGTITFA